MLAELGASEPISFHALATHVDSIPMNSRPVREPVDYQEMENKWLQVSPRALSEVLLLAPKDRRDMSRHVCS